MLISDTYFKGRNFGDSISSVVVLETKGELMFFYIPDLPNECKHT